MRKSTTLSRLENIFSSLGFGNRRKHGKKGCCSAKCGKGRSFKIEPLEERALLSVCTWDGGGSDNNWSTAANWANDVAPVTNDSLVFSGSTRTATTNDYANTSFNSITLNSSNFTLGGNDVSLAGNVTVASGVVGASITTDLNFTGVTAAVTEGAAANLSVTGTVNHSGSLTLTEGSAATLTMDEIEGSGSLVLTEGSAGHATIGSISDASSVTMTVGSCANVTVGSISDVDWVTVTEGSLATVSITSGLSTTGALTITEGSSSTLSISGGMSVGGTWTLTEGSSASATFSGDISESGMAFNLATGSHATIDGNLSGTGNLTKSGLGTLTLSGDNAFTGTTTINAGTLTLGSTNALAGSTLVYSTTGGTLNFGTLTTATLGGLSGVKNLALTNASSQAVSLSVGGNNADTTYSGTLSGDGNLTKVGGGTFTLDDATLDVNTLSVETGTLVLESGTTVDATTIKLAYPGYNRSGTITQLDGSAVTAGTVIVGDREYYDASDSYGTYNMAGGTLTVSNIVVAQTEYGDWGWPDAGWAVGSLNQTGGTINVQTLTLGNDTYWGRVNATYNLSGGVLQAQTIQCGASTNYDWSYDSGEVRTFNWSGGTIENYDANTDLTIGSGLTLTTSDAIDFDIDDSRTATINAVLAGSGSLEKQGDYTLVLNAANTFSGTTTITDGTLRLGNAAALGGSTLDWDNNAGTLDIGSLTSLTLGAIQGGQDFVLANGASPLALTLGGNSATYSGVLSGSGSLTKTVGGTQILTADQTYTGGTTISGGTLQLGDNTASGSVLGTIADNGQLTISRSDAYTLPNDVSGSGNLTILGSSENPIALDGNEISVGVLSVETGTLVVGDDTTINATTIKLAYPGYNRTGTITQQDGSVVTVGTLIVGDREYYDGSDSYGTYNMAGGTLTANSIIVAQTEYGDWGWYDWGRAVGTFNQTGGAVKVQTLTLGNDIYWGEVTAIYNLGGGSLEVQTVQCGASTNYNWGYDTGEVRQFNLSGGTIANYDAATDLTINSDLVLTLATDGSGTFDIDDGRTATVSGVITGGGSLVKTGDGTLTLTGQNTYGGGTTIADGTLQVGDGTTVGSLFGTITDNASLVFNSSENITIDNVLTGTGTMTKLGAGTLTLAGPGTPTVTIIDPNNLIISGGAVSLFVPTVMVNMPMTLTAAVADLDGTCQGVSFYIDVNENGVVDAGDTLLATGVNNAGIWSATIDTTGWSPSTDTVLAQATFPANTPHPPVDTVVSGNLNIDDTSAILSSANPAGYAESGTGFSTVAATAACGGFYRVMSGSDSTAYATYTFTNLSPGNYEIWKNIVANGQYSSNVTVQVYDGDAETGTLQQTFGINETATSDWSDWTVDGYVWSWSGGQAYCNSGTITVRIVANGDVVELPAIKLLSAPDSISTYTSCTASKDPVNYATGVSQYCGCGGALPLGTSYDNTQACTLGETGYGYTDKDVPLLSGEGMYVQAKDECGIDEWEEPIRNYAPINGTKATLRDIDSNGDGNGDYLLYTQTDGTQYKYSYPDSVAFAIGTWIETITPDGDTTDKVALWTDGNGNTSTSYSATYCHRAEVQHWSDSSTADESEAYTYTTIATNVMRSSVTYRHWDSTTSAWVNDKKVSYFYYGSGDTNGLACDLKAVATQYWDGSAWTGNDTIYYRYYTEATYDGSTQIGFAHGVKRELLAAAFNSLATSLGYGNASIEDRIAAVSAVSEANIAAYTCFYYQYNADQRVTYEEVYGQLRSTSYEYTEGSNTMSDASLWVRKTVETREDGSVNTVYTNFMQETLFSDLYDATSGTHTYTYNEYDAEGHTTLSATSSAIAGYWDGQTTSVNYGSTTPTDYHIHLALPASADSQVYEYTYDGPSGNVATISIANGLVMPVSGYRYANSTTQLLESYTYTSHVGTDGYTLYEVATHTQYTTETTTVSSTDSSTTPTTSYTYAWYSSSSQYQSVTVVSPAVSVSQNGDGTASQAAAIYSSQGNPVWWKDAAGTIAYYKYDSETGLRLETIEDVDTTATAQFTTADLALLTTYGWSTPTGGGQNLVTDYSYDSQDRLVQTLGPAHDVDGTSTRTASWTVYDNANHQTRSASGYAVETSLGNGLWTVCTLVNPVSITKTNADGDVMEQIQATRASSSGKLLPTDTFAQSSYVAWTTYAYSHKQLVSVKSYDDIPTSGTGTAGTNYDETILGYDSVGRKNRVKTADGTITRVVYDARGNVLSTWVGTDDENASDQYPQGVGPSDNNMVMVSSSVYDADGRVTESATYYGDGPGEYYTTEYQYDWQGRTTDVLIAGDVVTHYEYDNLSRTLCTETYASADFTLSTSELRAKSENLYDSRGRVYESHTYEVDPDDGTVGDYLPSETWYDAAGRVVKTANGNGLFQKVLYNGLGQLVVSYTSFDADETAYADADDVTGDTVVSLTNYYYDMAGQTVATATFERMSDDTTTTGALDATNSYTTASVAWYDGIGRTVASVNYGREDVDSGLTHYIFNGTTGALIDTDADGIPDVAEDEPPAVNSSDNYIVSLVDYDSAGRAYRTTDNMGRENWTVYDDAGRTIKSIQNYDDGTVEETETACDITVEYEYDSAGRLVTMIAYNAKGDDNDANNENVESQATKYLYESEINASWQTAMVYPDSSDVLSQNATTKVWTITTDNGDHTETTYDQLGRTTSTTDQRGVVHSYSYDSAGRVSADTGTSLGTSGIVDDNILRIGTTYDDIGRVEKITSYSDTSGTTVVNQVQYVYDSWGNLYREYQEHDGAVDQNTLFTEYDYADGASGGVAKYVRLTDVVYPNGRDMSYNYGTTEAIDDIMSRLASITDSESTGTVAGYKYLGAGQIIEEDGIGTKLTYLDSNGNVTGLDRFGRVIDQIWENYDATPTVFDHYTYQYDRAGNRTAKSNVLKTDHLLDETYQYDDIDRLIEWAIGGTTQETWSLDSLGNNLAAGTYNAANEETPTQGSSGYDRAGNMITLRSGNSAIYDAWNRQTKVTCGSGENLTVVQQNAYDGTNRRIQIFSSFDANGNPTTVQDDYHVGQQVVESDVTDNLTTTPTRNGGYQYLWSLRYIDAAILRDTLTTAGTGIVAASRVLYTADANYNVTGLLKYDSGQSQWSVAERNTYTPYGVVTYSNADWSTATSSANANTILYTGRTLDLLMGLFYYRARFYDAVLERFISRDPIAADVNLYRYCGNDPMSRTDPTGLKQCWCVSEPKLRPDGSGYIGPQQMTINVEDRVSCVDACAARRDGGFTWMGQDPYNPPKPVTPPPPPPAPQKHGPNCPFCYAWDSPKPLGPKVISVELILDKKDGIAATSGNLLLTLTCYSKQKMTQTYSCSGSLHEVVTTVTSTKTVDMQVANVSIGFQPIPGHNPTKPGGYTIAPTDIGKAMKLCKQAFGV